VGDGVDAERVYEADQYAAWAWGHVFGGRYKAIVVEEGACFWTVMDYVHLNPVRADWCGPGEGLEGYGWSSLGGYLRRATKRPAWLETGMGYAVTGCRDTAAGRRKYLRLLEERVD